MLPIELQKEKFNKFCHKFAKNVLGTKELVYVFTFRSVNNCHFVDFMFFTRMHLATHEETFETYHRDYYYLNGRVCFATTPGAVLKAKKGDYRLDINGKKIPLTRKVEEKEERIFVYDNFETFMKKMKNLFFATLKQMKVIKEKFLYISTKTYKKEPEAVRRYKEQFNNEIRELNHIIVEYQSKDRNNRERLKG